MSKFLTPLALWVLFSVAGFSQISTSCLTGPSGCVVRNEVSTYTYNFNSIELPTDIIFCGCQKLEVIVEGGIITSFTADGMNTVPTVPMDVLFFSSFGCALPGSSGFTVPTNLTFSVRWTGNGPGKVLLKRSEKCKQCIYIPVPIPIKFCWENENVLCKAENSIIIGPVAPSSISDSHNPCANNGLGSTTYTTNNPACGPYLFEWFRDNSTTPFAVTSLPSVTLNNTNNTAVTTIGVRTVQNNQRSSTFTKTFINPLPAAALVGPSSVPQGESILFSLVPCPNLPTTWTITPNNGFKSFYSDNCTASANDFSLVGTQYTIQALVNYGCFTVNYAADFTVEGAMKGTSNVNENSVLSTLPLNEVNLKDISAQSISETGMEKEVTLFPNPVQKGKNLNILNTKGWKESQIKVIDSNGRIVREGIIANENQPLFEVQTNSLEKGVYLLQIFSNDEISAIKFIVTE
jgi:hypothetical protein